MVTNIEHAPYGRKITHYHVRVKGTGTDMSGEEMEALMADLQKAVDQFGKQSLGISMERRIRRVVRNIIARIVPDDKLEFTVTPQYRTSLSTVFDGRLIRKSRKTVSLSMYFSTPPIYQRGLRGGIPFRFPVGLVRD